MGLYVEVMCDELAEWPEGSGNLNMLCTTHRGDNPQGNSVREAKESARTQGWKYRDGRWICPDCFGFLRSKQS